MKRLKTMLVVVFAVAAFAASFTVPAWAVLTRTAAAAPGVVFLSTSLPRQMRAEGLTETVGEVVLTANAAGNILDGSSIDLLYSADITNAPASGSLAGTLTCTGGCPASVTATLVGTNILRIGFANPGPPPGDGFGATGFAAGDTITVALVRVNANQAGVGGVTATMSGSSASPATNPISFTDPIRTVGVVFPTLTSTFTAAPGQLTCAPTFQPAAPGLPGTNFTITSTEVFPAALATAGQEAAFSPGTLPATVPANGTLVIVTISGVPAGFQIVPTFAAQTTSAGLAVVPAPAVPLTFTAVPARTLQAAGASGAPIAFAYAVTGSNTAAVESFTLGFSIGTPAGASVASGGATGPVTATVSVGPIGGATVVRFAANLLGPFGVGNVADCVTRLLMTWAANVAGFDTGFAFANTSEDDAAFGTGGTTARAQSGTCVLTGYPSAGGAPISFTTPVIPAGQTLPVILSSTTGFSGFTGYILAVCNFLNAHSFVFLIDSFGQTAKVAEGYLGLVIPVAGGGRTGGGAGEVLAH